MKYSATGPILPASVARTRKTRKRQLSVLYVEDDASWVSVVSRKLNPNGERFFDVLPVPSVSEGVALLSERPSPAKFHIILLDLNLPDCGRDETFDIIHGVAEDLPIVVLSGEEDPDFAIRLVERGAQDFLLKDFIQMPEVLARSLYSAVERHRILKERDELQSQLIQAEKLESLGRIAAGVAHEVKNPLAIIQMGIAYIQSELSKGGSETLLKVCESVQAASNRAVGIIGGMVDFARDDSVRLVKSDLGSVVRQSIEFLSYEIQRSKVEVAVEWPPELPPVMIDESKMQQVIMNLVRNSLQAMDGGTGEKVSITAFARPVDEVRHIAGFRRLVEGREGAEVVTLEIRDEGPGIPEDKISQVFEPFFTSKPKGKGAGLGLSVVFHIVELHGALILVRNEENPTGLKTSIHFVSPFFGNKTTGE